MPRIRKPTPPPQFIEAVPRLALSIEEAAEALSAGATNVYVLVREGKLGIVPVGPKGGKFIIPVEELLDYLRRSLVRKPTVGS